MGPLGSAIIDSLCRFLSVSRISMLWSFVSSLKSFSTVASKATVVWNNGLACGGALMFSSQPISELAEFDSFCTK